MRKCYKFKSLAGLIVLTLCCFCADAQETKNPDTELWRIFATDKSLTYKEIVRKCDSLFAAGSRSEEEHKAEAAQRSSKNAREREEREEENDGDNDPYSQYCRWKVLAQTRLGADGKLYSRPRTANTASKQMYYRQCSEGENQWSDWKFIGPQNMDVPHLGRVHCIQADPYNTQVVYVSDAWGGLWKTVNGGTSWACLTDNDLSLSGLGVNKFVVDFSSTPHRIFAAVGYIAEGYHLRLDPQTEDLYYSYDDGQTFSKANSGVNWDIEETVSDMKIDPYSPNYIFLTTRFKVLRVNLGPTASPSVSIGVVLDFDGYYNGGSKEKDHFAGFSSVLLLPPNGGAQPDPMLVCARAQMDLHNSSGMLLRTNIALSPMLSNAWFTDITSSLHTAAFNANADLIQSGDFNSPLGWGGLSAPGHPTDWDLSGGAGSSAYAGPLPYVSSCLEQRIMGYFGPTSTTMQLGGDVYLQPNTRLLAYLVDDTDFPWDMTGVCNTTHVQNNIQIYNSDADPNHVFNQWYTLSALPFATSGIYYNRVYFQVEYKSGYSGGSVQIDNVSLKAPVVKHIALGTSPAAPGALYSMVTTYDGPIYVQRSRDYGNTWSDMGYVNGVKGWAVPEGAEMVVSTIDSDKIYYGPSQDNLKVFNAGDTGPDYDALGYDYWGKSVPTHGDIRSLAITNTSSNTEVLYTGHDGGLSVYDVATAKWTCYTCGNSGSLPYVSADKYQSALLQGIGTDVYNGDVAVSAWDNGVMTTNKNDFTKWSRLDTLDGWRVKFSRRRALQHSVLWTNNANKIKKSQALHVYIPSANGITPPATSNILSDWFARIKTTDEGEYFADRDVYRLEITGATATWSNRSNNTFNGKDISAFAADPEDKDVMAAYGANAPWYTSGDMFALTTDGGATWYTGGQVNPFNWGTPNDLAIDPVSTFYGKRVWAGMMGYSGNPGHGRVFVTDNSGASWSDYSSGLPDGPVNALAYDHQAKILYAATDIGVYFRKVNEGGDWMCFSKNLPNAIVTDLEYDRCQRKLYAATYGRGAWQSDLYPNWNWVDPTDPSTTMVISGSTPVIWNQDKQLHKHVVIQPGAKLIIDNCTVNIDRGLNFVIENGGTMAVVNNAKLTNACACMWSDIILKGDSGVVQSIHPATPLQNTTSNQGLLIVENSTIERALNAILVGDGYFTGYDYPIWRPGGDGGAVVAENSQFKNCDRVVSFNMYKHKQHSYFKNCILLADEFLQDEQYVNNATGAPRRYGTETFGSSWLSDGVLFDNCIFKVDLTKFSPDPDLRGVGWGTGDANSTIKNCTFENLTRGTYMSSMYPTTSSTLIDHSTYTNNWRAAAFLGINDVTFTKNNITVGDPLVIDGWGRTGEDDPNLGFNLDPYGVYYSQAQSFTIQDNIIDKTSTAASTWGVIMNRVADPTIPKLGNYALYRNTLKTHVGITANQDNRGVQIKCNKLLDDNIGLLVSSYLTTNGSTPGTGWIDDQGDCLSANGPADNEFNPAFPPCGPTNGDHITVAPGNHTFAYTARAWAPYQPMCSVGPMTFTCGLNCPSGLCCPDPPVGIGVGGENGKMASVTSEQVTTAMDNLDKEVSNLKAKIAAGDDLSLYSAVNDGTKGSASLVQILQEAGPYLSDELLTKIIDRQPAMDYDDLKKIIIANSGLRTAVWDELRRAQPQLAADADVSAMQTSASPRVSVEESISGLYSQRGRLLAWLTAHYQEQENWTAAAELYNAQKAYGLAFPYYLKAQNFAAAEKAVGNIQDEGLRKVYMMQLNRIIAGKNLRDSLTKLERQELNQLAAHFETKSGEIARLWLAAAEGRIIHELMPAVAKGNNGGSQPDTRPVFTTAIDVYPNPAQDEVNVQIKNGSWSSGTVITVFDIIGRKIMSTFAEPQSSLVKLNSQKWSVGIYTIVVQQASKKAQTFKIEIQK